MVINMIIYMYIMDNTGYKLKESYLKHFLVKLPLTWAVQNLIQFDKFRRVSYQITRGQYDGAQTGPVSHDAITRSLMKFSSQFITIVKRYIPTDKS